MPTLTDPSLALQRRRNSRRTTRRITRAVPVAASVALLITACGGDGTTTDQRRPSTGAVASPAAPPSAPDDRTGAQTGGDASSFAELFGPPTDRLDDVTTTAPTTTVPTTTAPTSPPTTTAPTSPPTTAAPTTTAPTAPVTVPAEAMGTTRTPVAPIAADFDRFRADIDELHTLLVDNDATLARLDLSADRWASSRSITIPDGSLRAVPIDGGIVGSLLDVDGSVAGVIVNGDASSVEVLTAVVTLVVQLAADTELDAIAARWDDAAANDVTDALVPAADGGFWVVSSTGGIVTLMKLQDASPEWVTEHGPLFVAETILAVPPA